MQLRDISKCSGVRRIIYGILTVILAVIGDFFRNKESMRRRLTKQRALDELRAIRESGLRENEKVIDLWKLSLCDHINKLGYEKYSILEQVFIAALDTGDDDLACECLDRLLTKFRNSCRVNRLFGMYLESKGNFEDAQNVYSKLIKDDPTNTLARKRMVTILIAQQKIPEAINELREYLKIFMSDFEAWSKLADLYLSECDYKHAAFCMEEMILSNPSNHLYYQRGTENLELARTYYTQACLLCPNNLRSLYGLLLTCSALDNHLTKSIKMLSQTSENKLQNGPSNGNTYSNVTDDVLGVNTNHHSNQSSRLSANQVSIVSSPPQTSSLTNTEKNRHLAKWAAGQIRLIYSSTERFKQRSSERQTDQFINNTDNSSNINNINTENSVTDYDHVVNRINTHVHNLHENDHVVAHDIDCNRILCDKKTK
ncbi:ER membrane protein complex subunit 2 [Schistosoma japonicum]|nr:ER membrane protein complex subunit 2 [Schistosoma japonicum]KAH8874250.1 ER membrane protein complex subunit 2 [Schistosoma japonicum]